MQRPVSVDDILGSQTQELREALHDVTTWHQQIRLVIDRLRLVFDEGGNVFTAGNGGSATLAQHFSDEMVGRYKNDRRPYPVIALTADSAVLTCVANDYGYEQVFARQLEALGRAGDVLIAFSTSGESANILTACLRAQSQQMTVIGFSGPTGPLRTMCDLPVVSPATTTARIQELDLHAIHLICEAFETA
ncbi:MAG: SIS domain-containing protein [Pirellulales bacterium]